MQLNTSNLKLAVQKKGRLAQESLSLLKSLGLSFDSAEGRLSARCHNFPLDILYLRDDDIPEYVQDGVADLGIVGLNVIEEKQAETETLDSLGFGYCTLALAIPATRSDFELTQLAGKRIATSHPRILKRFLDRKNVEARVIRINGSVEIAPALDVADAICDLVSTGSTLKMNGLQQVETVLRSQATLVGNPRSLQRPRRSQLIAQLRNRLASHLKARNTKYVMMNAPRASLKDIEATLPGMTSPTVMPLADPDMIAVHSAVPESVFWEVMENLKSAGARDILVLPVEKIVV